VTLFYERLRVQVARSAFLHQIGTLAGGTIIGQAMVLLTYPLITRLYTPVELGQFGILMAVLAVSAVAASLRYELAVVSASTDSEALALAVGALLISLPGAVLTGVFVGACIHFGWLGFGAVPSSAAYWAVPAQLVLQVFFVLRYWHLRHANFHVIARVTIEQGFARATAPILLHFFGWGWAGLIGGEVIARCAGLRAMVLDSYRELRRVWAGNVSSQVVTALARYRHFPLYAMPSSVINALANNLPLPLIAIGFGPVTAGQYALVQRVLQAPVGLIGGSVADAFHSRLAFYVREAPKSAAGLFRKCTVLLVIAGLPMVAILVLGAEPLFARIFGGPWREAGAIALWLLPWTYAMLVVSPLSRAVQVLGGQRTKLIYDVLSVVTTLVTFPVAKGLGWGLRSTIIMLSVVQASTYVVYYLLLYRMVANVAVAAPRALGGELAS
jgi:O-antigen/teichoic acid export membrane protein